MAAVTVSEAEWLAAVADMLDLYGWYWIHPLPARRADGRWRTAAQGNSAKGFPELVCVRPPRVVWIELKSEKGRVSPEQRAWIDRLQAAGQEAAVARLPQDWDSLAALLAPDPEQLTMTSNSTPATIYNVR